MSAHAHRNCRRSKTLLIASLLVVATTAAITAVDSYEFATPLFGLAVAPDGSLLVADAGAGIVELRKGVGTLIAELPGVTDIAPIGRGEMFAIRGGGPGLTTGSLFRVSRGSTRLIADLYAFEAAANPHPAAIDSNPFDVEDLGDGVAVVADAGGNDLLIVDDSGRVDWIASFPNEVVPTADIKHLLNCPAPPPGFERICTLPPTIPAQAVSTSVAIGPDGAYYVGELKGFPAPIGKSRIWRVEPGARHAVCGSSDLCTVVADGFTSIVDLTLGRDGTLYVTELDEATWAAVEFGRPLAGGTVNACDTSSWTCREIATGLTMPIATAVDRRGAIFVAINALIPGAARIIALQ
ncbi:MAG TPA: ScyD/ScyE family protein [Vicinamibacterales bacterium]|nr:ScyD/ScyE family protein [Vicinamibacterales bacterium]